MSIWDVLGLTRPPLDSDGAPDAVAALEYLLERVSTPNQFGLTPPRAGQNLVAASAPKWRGGIIAVTPGNTGEWGSTWALLFADNPEDHPQDDYADYQDRFENWIVPQLDAAARLGCNAAGVQCALNGLSEEYDFYSLDELVDRYAQVIDYCATLGMGFSAEVGAPAHSSMLTQAERVTAVTAFCEMLEEKPNVISVDVGAEFDVPFEDANGFHAVPFTLPELEAYADAAHAACTLPVTCSYSGLARDKAGIMATNRGIEPFVDFYGYHFYPYDGVEPDDGGVLHALNWASLNWHAETTDKPFMINEFGAPESWGDAIIAQALQGVRTIAERPDCMGALMFSISDIHPDPGYQLGLFGASPGFPTVLDESNERTIKTNELGRLPSSRRQPLVANMFWNEFKLGSSMASGTYYGSDALIPFTSFGDIKAAKFEMVFGTDVRIEVEVFVNAKMSATSAAAAKMMSGRVYWGIAGQVVGGTPGQAAYFGGVGRHTTSQFFGDTLRRFVKERMEFQLGMVLGSAGSLGQADDVFYTYSDTGAFTTQAVIKIWPL